MKSIEPMLCKKANSKILASNEYFFQPKLDGTRALFIEGKLINRRGRNIRYRYPEFKSLEIKNECVIDGEVVVYNEKGLPDFKLLQSREQTSNKLKIELLSKRYPATYVVFDCLKYKDKDLLTVPVEKRLEYLEKAVIEGNNLQIIFSTEDGKFLWDKIKSMGVEGVMAKKKGSRYHPGKRSKVCLKIKNLNTIDCIILGYTKGEGKRENTFGALRIGAYNEGELIKLGKVGTGWTDQELIDLKRKLDTLIINELDDTIYVKKELVCEVEFLELTDNLELRAPSFKGLRYDKEPKDCSIKEYL
ncbi:MAG: DNA ligase [Candidatus Lokiarchaeota archaeon]|nr:DNA ligase [Candidatus Lokiarchaeota archaeon]MBD3199640.1 DNA ligase [Candidatus Lokiarchaeota archaeon]